MKVLCVLSRFENLALFAINNKYARRAPSKFFGRRG